MDDLEKKKKFFIEIKRIACLQKAAIERGDIQDLQELIDERQRYVDAIEDLQDQSVDEELVSIIIQIQNIDQVNRSMLERLMDDTVAKVNGIKSAKMGLSAYHTGFSQIVSAFVDKKM